MSVLACSVRVHVVRCGPYERQLLAGVSTTAEFHFTLLNNCGFAPQVTSTELTGFYRAWLKTLKAGLISMSASMPQPESASWFGLGIKIRKAARPSLHDDSEWVWLDLWMSVPQNKEQTDLWICLPIRMSLTENQIWFLRSLFFSSLCLLETKLQWGRLSEFNNTVTDAVISSYRWLKT